MKKILSRFGPGVAAVAVALAACLATVTVVDAQTPPTPPHPPGHPMMGGPGQQHGMRMMRELDRFKTSLQLNAQQSAAWDRAVAAMKPQGDMRAQMKAQHDRMAAMLDDPNFDPRRMAAEMDRLGAEHRAKMNSVREAWFAVYDTLNPVQRGQVREFLRERMSHRMHERHDRGGWKHEGDGREGPMAPPPAR
jgi:Spy/CpxP family protein refolding chaperone